MSKKLLLTTTIAFFNYIYFSFVNPPISDNGLLIYGTVTTDEDRTYTGQIRWGDEEAFWFDFFNSSKPSNDFIEYLDDDEIDALNDNHNIFKKNRKNWNWSWNSDHGNWSNHTHVFAVRFGDIASIDVGRRDRIKVKLKNGEVIRLEGGSNDIGTNVQVVDSEIGNIKLDWSDITKVEFMNTPASIENHYGEPLYGTVNTVSESFTGYVQWDHDERLGKDELNGDHEDGELDIPFGTISSIKAKRRGSEVELKSGRTFYLTGSNDVNDDNRGIIVNIDGLGRVDIPWDEFVDVQFTDAPANSNIDYASFNKGGNEIKGSIQVEKGEDLSGNIVFDLDEQYLCEMLNGKKDDIDYFIPFANIHKISPLSRSKTEVELKSGKKIALRDAVDVDDNNDGALVFSEGSDDPQYTPWHEVQSIVLK